MKNLILLFLVCLVGHINANNVRDVVYTTRYDTLDLYMTIYEPTELKFDHVILYVHGGAFMTGSRNDSIVVAYCRVMSERGFRVATIDYRLGMESFTLKGMKFVKAIQSAIYMAVEDCSAAVVYLIEKEGVDADKVILAGSSAGAITVLQTDYMHSNGSWHTALLPDTLRFAGVIAYSGAVLTTEGLIDYARSPAPTMLFHGTKDNIVTYNEIRLFKHGFFGTNSLVKRLKKYNCPYYVRRYKGLSHEVCHYGSKTALETEYFVQRYIIEKRHLIIDETYKNTDIDPKIEHYDQLRYEFTHNR